jgi:hypothetical protein
VAASRDSRSIASACSLSGGAQHAAALAEAARSASYGGNDDRLVDGDEKPRGAARDQHSLLADVPMPGTSRTEYLVPARCAARAAVPSE